MTELLPCPFCDGQPGFTAAEIKDERRYVQMNLECCSIEMRATIGWAQYRLMTEKAIDKALKSELIAKWNTRGEGL